MWLRGKGSLRKEDQQFGEWLCADSVRGVRKSVIVISGSTRAQAPWWRKPDSKATSSSRQSEDASAGSKVNDCIIKVASTENMMRDIEGLKLNNEGSSQ